MWGNGGGGGVNRTKECGGCGGALYRMGELYRVGTDSMRRRGRGRMRERMKEGGGGVQLHRRREGWGERGERRGNGRELLVVV